MYKGGMYNQEVLDNFQALGINQRVLAAVDWLLLRDAVHLSHLRHDLHQTKKTKDILRA